MCSDRAGTRDIFEIEIAGADKIAEAARGFCSQQALCLASRSPCLRRIEAYEPDVRLLLIDADRVAIDHANVVGVDGPTATSGCTHIKKNWQDWTKNRQDFSRLKNKLVGLLHPCTRAHAAAVH